MGKKTRKSGATERPRPRFFEIQIMDDVWRYRVMSHRAYSHLHDSPGEVSAAVTDKEKFTIDFRPNSLTFEICKHEVFHAYWHYQCIDDACLSDHQREEVAAELYARWGDRMSQKARLMLQQLRKQVKWIRNTK